MTTRYASVEDLPIDAQILDSNSSAERWSTGPEDSQWFCGGCGAALDDETEPCEHCLY